MPFGQMTSLWQCRRNIMLFKCLTAKCLSAKYPSAKCLSAKCRRPNARRPNACRPNARRPNARRPNARRPNDRRPNACRPNDKSIAVSTKHHFDQMPVGQMTGLWLCRQNVTLVKCLSARCLSTKSNVALEDGQTDVPVSLCELRRLRRPICLQPQSPVFKVVKLFFFFVSNVAAKVS
jgi:hypothetical protein